MATSILVVCMPALQLRRCSVTAWLLKHLWHNLVDVQVCFTCDVQTCCLRSPQTTSSLPCGNTYDRSHWCISAALPVTEPWVYGLRLFMAKKNKIPALECGSNVHMGEVDGWGDMKVKWVRKQTKQNHSTGDPSFGGPRAGSERSQSRVVVVTLMLFVGFHLQNRDLLREKLYVLAKELTLFKD